MEFINARPARALQPAPVAVNLYAGWRVFQAKCSQCHGTSAKGSEQAPNLLPIVRTMSARHFSEMVLKRYDLGNGLTHGSEKKSTTESYIDDILNRKEPAITMPAWQGEPTVNAHILDLYAYLTARAEGKFSTERPAQ
jgi:cytochrome c2